jgi:hypothetical protein
MNSDFSLYTENSANYFKVTVFYQRNWMWPTPNDLFLCLKTDDNGKPDDRLLKDINIITYCCVGK